MAIVNLRIQINGGSGAPTQLKDRELFYDTSNNALYIGNNDGIPILIDNFSVNKNIDGSNFGNPDDNDSNASLNEGSIKGLYGLTVTDKMIIDTVNIQDMTSMSKGSVVFCKYQQITPISE